MRQFCILFLLFCAAGCKKSDTAIAVDSIQGKWEIRAIQAGMTPTLIYEAGNGHYLLFEGNNYKEIKSGATILTGTYTVRKESTSIEGCPNSSPQPVMTKMIWSPSVGGREPFFYFDGNRLKFISGCFALDGGIFSEWEKVK